MKNFDEDTNAYADETDMKGGREVKDYAVSRVVVNPDVFALLRKNTLSDPIKRERWLITRLGESPTPPSDTAVNGAPVFMPSPKKE